jgi:subtilisin family serine protease
VRPETLSPEARGEYDRFQEIRRELERERAESQQMLQQARMITVALERATAVLRGVVGAEPLTGERVRAIASTRPDVLQARDIYLQLDEAGITARDLEKALEYAERRLQYGLNPEFDPRPIVGDNYDDVTERFYGNADVIGPDADHGTHVAGIVAAERGNRIGIEGIAPTARIMAIRAVPNGDERDKDVANAIRYAVDNGAHIINMSFGKAYSPQKGAVDEAVRYAEERGVLLVHAAGNEATELALRANFPSRVYLDGGSAANWIEVGASSWRPGDALVAPFSNFDREQVDVFAPGVDILSTIPGNEYEPNSGTSMAAPVVSGLAALLMAYFPDLTATDVRRVILESAVLYGDERVVAPGGSGRVLFRDLSATGGVVNAYTAVQMAQRLAQQGR